MRLIPLANVVQARIMSEIGASVNGVQGVQPMVSSVKRGAWNDWRSITMCQDDPCEAPPDAVIGSCFIVFSQEWFGKVGLSCRLMPGRCRGGL